MKRKKAARKKANPLEFKWDSVGSWVGSLEVVARVGGGVVGRGGYIWFGEPGATGRCVGFVGMGKFLRLARNIERARKRGVR